MLDKFFVRSMCQYVHLFVWVWVHICDHMWKPAVNLKCYLGAISRWSFPVLLATPNSSLRNLILVVNAHPIWQACYYLTLTFYIHSYFFSTLCHVLGYLFSLRYAILLLSVSAHDSSNFTLLLFLPAFSVWLCHLNLSRSTIGQ